MSTFSFSPYLITVIIFIFQTILLLGMIWFPRSQNPQQTWQQAIFKFGKTLFYPLYLVMGILVLDMGIAWLSGLWMYTDYRFHLPSVIIGILAGIQYCWGVWLEKPRLLEILTGMGIVAGMIYAIHWYIPSFVYMREPMTISIGLIAGIGAGVSIIGGLLVFILEKKGKQSLLTKPLWNTEKQYLKFFSLKYNIGFWFVAFLNTILIFYGKSLFIW